MERKKEEEVKFGWAELYLNYRSLLLLQYLSAASYGESQALVLSF